jgi:radical SAM protein with 4Fe4S-binding SPASM domain
MFFKQVAPFRPYIYFCGGEPLMKKDISDIIRGASRQHLVTSLSTNGLLLKEKAQEILDSGLDYLYISLDGPPNIDEKIREGTQAIGQLVDDIKYFLDFRARSGSLSPMVEVRATVCKENESKLFETASFVDRVIKPEAFGLIGLNYTTRPQFDGARPFYKEMLGIDRRLYWESSVFDPEVMNTDILSREFDRIKKGKWGFRLHLYPPLDHKRFSWSTYFNSPDNDIGKIDYCGALYSIGVIQPNGNVATCPTAQDYITGNIRNSSFLDIWRGDKHNFFRKAIERCHPATCCRCRGWFSYRKA